jgi:hypothetical protein
MKLVIAGPKVPLIESHNNTALSLESLGESAHPQLVGSIFPSIGEKSARCVRGKPRRTCGIWERTCWHFVLIEAFLAVTGNIEPVRDLLVVVN